MTMRPVLEGDPIQVAVLGGFIHRSAPCDGFAVDVGDTCAFVSAAEMNAAQAGLKLLRRAERKE